MEMCSTLLAIREIQINIHSMFARVVNTNKQKQQHYTKYMMIWTPRIFIHCWWECKIVDILKAIGRFLIS